MRRPAEVALESVDATLRPCEVDQILTLPPLGLGVDTQPAVAFGDHGRIGLAKA